MNKEEEIKKGKFLSLILRHKPEKVGLKLDENGWVNVDDLIQSTNISLSELEQIVKNNNKNRYSFSEDKRKIRANQGHSLNVDVELKEVYPPYILYHGTAEKNIDSIVKNGLVKGNRNHVHLSGDEATAINVGSRHGKPVVLKINAKDMYADGLKFYISENGVFLTDYVDPMYIFYISYGK